MKTRTGIPIAGIVSVLVIVIMFLALISIIISTILNKYLEWVN